MSALTAKMEEYFLLFRENDDEFFPTAISNQQAAEFLSDRIPLLELPDSDLERTYYFRWWTFRKHIRPTPDGYVLTEFLPDVRWAGRHNTINCAAGFHIREGRWLRDPEGILPQYIDHWLSGRGDALAYSTWIPAAVKEYCDIHGDISFGVHRLREMESLFAARLEKAKTESGLYFSVDDRDGMEYSISGSGLRPTLNSYLIGDARALSFFASHAGNTQKAQKYTDFADALSERMDALLWTGDFYRTIPQDFMHEPLTVRPAIPPDHDVRELVGYVPWYFGIPTREKDGAFDLLLREDVFDAPYGLTTAEQTHPRFMEKHSHECLWNGPVWPYATSQVLVGLANMLRRPHGSSLTKEDYVRILRTYALSHRRVKEGRGIDWIDENLHPFTGAWLSRDILEEMGWKPDKGGYERGKDYNHSLFCDLILSGLLGIGADENGALSVSPLIPDNWNWFRVENLSFRGSLYSIAYDRDGSRYGGAAGITITKQA